VSHDSPDLVSLATHGRWRRRGCTLELHILPGARWFSARPAQTHSVVGQQACNVLLERNLPSKSYAQSSFTIDHEAFSSDHHLLVTLGQFASCKFRRCLANSIALANNLSPHASAFAGSVLPESCQQLRIDGWGGSPSLLIRAASRFISLFAAGHTYLGKPIHASTAPTCMRHGRLATITDSGSGVSA